MRPNVVLINCDDLGYGDLGCYGSGINKTPGIDRLSQEGMRFTNFYMAAPVCTPSRGAMLTGCYPKRINFATFDEHDRWVLLPGNPHGLHPDEITIGTMLKQVGYRTALIGKWHCGDQPEFLPTRHGFDTYFGLPYSNDMCLRKGGKAPKNTTPLPLLHNEEVIQEEPDQAALTERYVSEAVHFIREHRDRPFFLYFAHLYVHTPLFVPQHFLDAADHNPYSAAVAAIDWSARAILYELEQQGLSENTLVIFTSDNGGGKNGCNDPLRGGKGTTWEGGQRVPCIMRWPGVIPEGSTCTELVTAMDFLPTLADICGAQTPQDRIIDGKNIVSLMRQEPDACTPHEAFFYYLRNDLEAVRSGPWKLHLQRRQLYNLHEDIAESHNLFDAYPEIVAELEGKAAACRLDMGDAITGIEGRNCRPVGRVDNPRTLTTYDPGHPYMRAYYD